MPLCVSPTRLVVDRVSNFNFINTSKIVSKTHTHFWKSFNTPNLGSAVPVSRVSSQWFRHTGFPLAHKTLHWLISTDNQAIHRFCRSGFPWEHTHTHTTQWATKFGYISVFKTLSFFKYALSLTHPRCHVFYFLNFRVSLHASTPR